MAITASGLFLGTWKSALTGGIVLNLDLETHKGVLYNDTLAPNYAAATAEYTAAPFTSNEVSGGSWALSGEALTGTTIDIASFAGNWVFDAADVSVGTTTLASAMGYVLMADALAAKNCILLVDFVTAVSTSNGTFEIVWTAPASGGIFYIDMTP
jgi:hypothetical protein